MELKDFKQRLDELSRTLPKQYRDENREGVQALIPYGTGYIQFEMYLGECPNLYMVVKGQKVLERLYDYIIEAWEDNNLDYNEPNLEFSENNTVIRMSVLISNSGLLKPRTANRLKQACDQLECLLVDVDEGGAVLLNYDADEFLFNNKYVHPEGLADDPVFANCNIMLERKQ